MIEAELIRSQTPVPQPDPRALILFGRILDQSYAAVSQAAIDVSVGGSRNVVNGRTDDLGRFVLSLPAHEGTTKVHLEITDSSGTTTTIDEGFDLKPGVV